MNTLKGLSLTALLLVGSMSFIAPTQATTEAPTQALSQAPVEAPLTALTYDEVSVTTSPAPIVEAPTQPLYEAPTEALIEAPAQAPTAPTMEAPAQAPTQAPETPTAAPTAPTAPVCMEDDPCWDCTTMGNLFCGPTAPETTAACPADFYLFAGGECIDPNSDIYVPTETQPLDQWLENKCDTNSYTSSGIARFCEYLAIGRGTATYPDSLPVVTETVAP